MRLDLLNPMKWFRAAFFLAPGHRVDVTEAHKHIVHRLLYARIWPMKFARRLRGDIDEQVAICNLSHSAKDQFRTHRILQRHRRSILLFSRLTTGRAFAMPESENGDDSLDVIERIGFLRGDIHSLCPGMRSVQSKSRQKKLAFDTNARRDPVGPLPDGRVV